MSSSFLVSPRNCSVTWNVSGSTQRTSGASCRIWLRNSAIRSRMAASISRATKRRIRSHQHPAHQVERLLAGPAPNTLAVSGKASLHNFVFLPVGHRDIDQPDRLFLCSPAGTRDTRNSDADIGIANLANVLRQSERDFLAHRAVGFDHQRRNIGEQRLQIVGINYGPTQKIARTAWYRRDALGDHSPGTRFGNGQLGITHL